MSNHIVDQSNIQMGEWNAMNKDKLEHIFQLQRKFGSKFTDFNALAKDRDIYTKSKIGF